jgi:hemoglobin
MLTSGRYKGQPIVTHARRAVAITREVFTRWLELWPATAEELMPPDPAAALQDKAGRIVESLALGVDFYRNQARASPARYERHGAGSPRRPDPVQKRKRASTTARSSR